MERYVYRPTFSRVLAVSVAAICLVALVAVLIDNPADAVGVLPWLLLAAGAAWMVFWYPSVEVDDSGVRMVNVTRTIDLPWPSISRIDTKWALELITGYGRFTAWAAPAPGRMSARKLSRRESQTLPESTYVDKGTIRPGDAPGSPSGDVALVIRRRWDELRDAGYLDNPVLESDRPRIHWHVLQLTAGVVLLGLGLLATTF